jgi:CBS domain-containing protein
MVANMLSFAISKRYQPVPVYHALLHQDGVHLPLPATQALTTARTARHVTQTDVSLIPPDASVEQAWKMTVENGAPAYLVGTRDRLVGTISHQRLEDSRRSGKAADPVTSIADQSFVHAHPDHPIDVVLERFAQSGGILPVVSRADAHRVEGVITIDSMLKIAERRSHSRESQAATAGASGADGNRNPPSPLERSPESAGHTRLWPSGGLPFCAHIDSGPSGSTSETAGIPLAVSPSGVRLYEAHDAGGAGRHRHLDVRWRHEHPAGRPASRVSQRAAHAGPTRRESARCQQATWRRLRRQVAERRMSWTRLSTCFALESPLLVHETPHSGHRVVQ